MEKLGLASVYPIENPLPLLGRNYHVILEKDTYTTKLSQEESDTSDEHFCDFLVQEIPLHQEFHSFDESRNSIANTSKESNEELSTPDPDEILFDNLSEDDFLDEYDQNAWLKGTGSNEALASDITSFKAYVHKITRILYAGYHPVSMNEVQTGSLVQKIRSKTFQPSHPNCTPLYEVIETENNVSFILKSLPYTLESIIKFNYHIIRQGYHGRSNHLILGNTDGQGDEIADIRLKFLFYQLVLCLSFLHENRLWHGSLSPTSVHVSNDLWVFIDPPQTRERSATREFNPMPLFRCLELSLTERWRHRDVSNYDYLMAINAAAGRRMGDPTFHPVIPWVTDFSFHEKNELDSSSVTNHWRDLSKSKFRIQKGDDQLHTTYKNSPIPHHITESLSEITYYIYMARRTPLSTLRKVVRSSFEAKEYPQSMQRMYKWTPDECIPEFYSDPSVFRSIHETMKDIELPLWCSTPEEFITWHRNLLESDQVSTNLHHWIDLNFGVLLNGEQAVTALNVPLSPDSFSFHRLRKNPGFVQVFTEPHPKRISSNYANRSDPQTVNSSNAFAIKYANTLSPVYYPEFAESTLIECQEADLFALGCLLAEMYLQQPLFTKESAKHFLVNGKFDDKCVELLNSLPKVARLLVIDLLEKRITACTALGHLFFPKWFRRAHCLLSAYREKNTWHEKLRYFSEAAKNLLADEIEPNQRHAAQQLMVVPCCSLKALSQFTKVAPALSFLNCPHAFTRSLALRELVGLFPKEESVRLLQLNIHVHDNLISKNKGDFKSLVSAFDQQTIRSILRSCGKKAFVEYFLPLLLDVLSHSPNKKANNKKDFQELELTIATLLETILEDEYLGISFGSYTAFLMIVERWKRKLLTYESVNKRIIDSWIDSNIAMLSSKRMIEVIRYILDFDHTFNFATESQLSTLIASLLTKLEESFIACVALPSLRDEFRRHRPNLDSPQVLDVVILLIYGFKRVTASAIKSQFLNVLEDCVKSLEFISVSRHAENPNTQQSILKIHLAVVVATILWKVGAKAIPPSILNSMNEVLRNLRFTSSLSDGPSEINFYVLCVLYIPLLYLFRGNEKRFQEKFTHVPHEYVKKVKDSFCREEEYHRFSSIFQDAKLDKDDDDQSGGADFTEDISGNSLGEINDIEVHPWVIHTERPWKNKVTHSVLAHRSGISTIEIDPEERLLFTSSKRGTVKIWNISHSPVEVMHVACNVTHSKPINCMRIVNNGKKVVLVDGSISLWDVEKEHQQVLNLSRSSKSIIAVEQVPESAGGDASGKVLWAASAGGTLTRIDIRQAIPTTGTFSLPGAGGFEMDIPMPICSMAFLPRNSSFMLAIGRTSGYISALDPRNGHILSHWKALESHVVSVMPFQGSKLFALGSNGFAKVFDLEESLESSLKESLYLRFRSIKGVRNLPISLKPFRVLIKTPADSIDPSASLANTISETGNHNLREGLDSSVTDMNNSPERDQVASGIAKQKSEETVSNRSPPLRMQAKIPTCDTVAMAEHATDTSVFVGGIDSISKVSLEPFSNELDTSTNGNGSIIRNVIYEDSYKLPKVQVNTLRYLQLRKRVVFGADSGHLCLVE